MLINLSVSDMLYGFSIIMWCMYFQPSSKTSLRNNATISRKDAILSTLILFSISASGISVVVVAIDRAVATFAPFSYRAMRFRYFARLIAFDWFFCLCIASVHFFMHTEYANSLMVFYAYLILFFLGIIIVTYTAIVIKVRLKRQIANRNEQTAQLRERKMAYTLMIVTACSVLTWVPLCIVFALHKRISGNIPVEMSACAFIAQASNSFINPIIYAFRIREFKKASYQVLCKCSGERINVAADRVS